MLDENLPTFFIQTPRSEDPYSTTILLGENGSEPQPIYTLRKPDPSLPAAKGCYAVALHDSYNPDVLYADVQAKPEWTQTVPSLAEPRTQTGVNPLVPYVPNGFTVQLYNPNQPMKVKHVAGTWNTSAHWEFEMPQSTFRVPSSSTLDQGRDAPALSDVTPKIKFKWKRDGKLSRDIACYLVGQTIIGKKSKEPDITIAFFKGGRDFTIYQPNMHRVEIEDTKGLEVALLLSGIVIKDLYFNANKEMFNLHSSADTATSEANLTKKTSFTSKPAGLSSIKPPHKLLVNKVGSSSMPPIQTASEIDAETERLRKIVEAEEEAQKKAEEKEQQFIMDMLDAEERENRERELLVEKETERLRKEYGVSMTPLLSPTNPNTGLRPNSSNSSQAPSSPKPLHSSESGQFNIPQVSEWLARQQQKQKFGNLSPSSTSTSTLNSSGLLNLVQKIHRKKSSQS
ncbi:unnamed protein product [Blumeria hordei]|uniref:Uncharacterized protein n=1 Tax=Blumeria hordei TaxID=2867405 RepID=A0A383UT56_BLUHO|nr:unnamed protein product [Blumeria hordei]